MPRRPFSRGSVPARAPRRLTAWDLGPGGDDLGTLDNVSVVSDSNVILGAGVTPLIPAITVVRIRGFIEVNLVAADAALSGFNFAAGIGIVTLDAFTAGAASVPNPFSDIQWPGWLWHHLGGIHAPQEILDLNQVAAQRIEVDSKAMRKVRLNEVMTLIMSFGETATATVNVRAATRALVKLP